MSKTEILRFHATVDEFPEDCWRDFEALSCISLYELGSIMLDAFDSWQYHLWYIVWKGRRYEAFKKEMEQYDSPWADESLDADEFTLDQLGLRVGSRLFLDYDYGTTWSFTMTLAERGPSSFPRLVGGRGGNMIEDVDPDTVREVIEFEKAGNTLSDSEELTELLREEDWGWRYDARSRPRILKPLLKKDIL